MIAQISSLGTDVADTTDEWLALVWLVLLSP